MVVTLAQSLEPTRPLPNFPTEGGSPNVTASGNSTTQTDAPKFALATPQGHWQGTAPAALQTIAASVGNNPNPLTTEYLYEPESAIYHGSEGDVVRSSALYLLHPVNQALSLLTHDSVYCLSEATAHNVRSDITYYRGARPFAVVEFKRRGVIRLAEFRAAVKAITPATSEASLVASASAHNSTHHTFFDGNSTILIKQAASYAINHRTRYVALFNWDFMVLCHFTNLNHAASKNTLIANGVGNYCEMEIIPFTESHRMRPSLLGFLTRAYNDTPQ